MMTYSGFVLVGGRSSRMGRDKALLPYRSATLVEHVAEQVRLAAGRVTLIGDPEKYARFGYPVVADSVQECGPLGGIRTALALNEADWNLIVSCDLPAVSSLELKRILGITSTDCDCVVPVLADGSKQPLCAAYHRRCLAKVDRAIADKRFKLMNLIADLSTVTLPVSASELLLNINSPLDWESLA